MSANGSYGTWTNKVNTYSTGPDADIDDYISSGDSDWRDRMQTSGAAARAKEEYRAAIERALPADVSLCGNEFIGPAEPEDGEFDDYPTDENGGLDFAAMIEDIDVEEIVERNDVLTLEDIGRDELKSTAKEPAKAASKAMSRLGVKPAYGYHPNPDSGRPQALYRAGDVRDALAARPGQGARTDKAGE